MPLKPSNGKTIGLPGRPPKANPKKDPRGLMTEMIDLHPDELDNQGRYKLLIGSVLPRPIAFVSTLSPEGHPNLAPFSFFTGVSSNPPVICFCPMRRRGPLPHKDTL